MHIRIKSAMIILFLACTSCMQKSFDTERELWAYVKKEGNGYTQHKTVNGMNYTLTYRPTDLLIKQALGNEISEENIAQMRKKYSKYMYFNLSMSKNDQELLSDVVGDRNEFGTMVHQLAFGMESKTHLFTSKRDTIPMIDYSYPRMYGMTKSTSMLFVYPRDKNNLQEAELHFTVEDLGFQTGEVRFNIPTQLLKNEPKLTFQ